MSLTGPASFASSPWTAVRSRSVRIAILPPGRLRPPQFALVIISASLALRLPGSAPSPPGLPGWRSGFARPFGTRRTSRVALAVDAAMSAVVPAGTRVVTRATGVVRRRALIPAAALFFAAATVVYTFPLVLSPGSLLLAGLGDHPSEAALIGWTAHQLLHAPRHLFDTEFFYPYSHTEAYWQSVLVPGPPGDAGHGRDGRRPSRDQRRRAAVPGAERPLHRRTRVVAHASRDPEPCRWRRLRVLPESPRAPQQPDGPDGVSPPGQPLGLAALSRRRALAAPARARARPLGPEPRRPSTTRSRTASCWPPSGSDACCSSPARSAGAWSAAARSGPRRSRSRSRRCSHRTSPSTSRSASTGRRSSPTGSGWISSRGSIREASARSTVAGSSLSDARKGACSPASRSSRWPGPAVLLAARAPDHEHSDRRGRWLRAALLVASGFCMISIVVALRRSGVTGPPGRPQAAGRRPDVAAPRAAGAGVRVGRRRGPGATARAARSAGLAARPRARDSGDVSPDPDAHPDGPGPTARRRAVPLGLRLRARRGRLPRARPLGARLRAPAGAGGGGGAGGADRTPLPARPRGGGRGRPG